MFNSGRYSLKNHMYNQIAVRKPIAQVKLNCCMAVFGTIWLCANK